MNTIISYIRDNFHPFFYLRKSKWGKKLLNALNFSIWHKRNEISFPFCIKIISHFAYIPNDYFPEPGFYRFLVFFLRDTLYVIFGI
ncbi:hypothetical protein A7Q10_02115 [Methylacidiphilum caldifontis]|uniref:Uncharacterized protein n=1 Tax=Methylacidiphilum caldifontis TaxID=2795386 RepID=A0A4Y8P808_9BACT|nr:hypothetical protein A7Q10_02115 [Methylacidiphilum caldifontis]